MQSPGVAWRAEGGLRLHVICTTAEPCITLPSPVIVQAACSLAVWQRRGQHGLLEVGLYDVLSHPPPHPQSPPPPPHPQCHGPPVWQLDHGVRLLHEGLAQARAAGIGVGGVLRFRAHYAILNTPGSAPSRLASSLPIYNRRRSHPNRLTAN